MAPSRNVAISTAFLGETGQRSSTPLAAAQCSSGLGWAPAGDRKPCSVPTAIPFCDHSAMKGLIVGEVTLRRDRWLALLVGGVALLASVAVAEYSLRFLASRSTHAQEVGKIQSLLRAHPALGYLWDRNLSLPVGTLTWADQVPRALTTDAFGFFNHPTAISRLAAGERVNLIGLGDSFVHDAANTFYEFFERRSLFYYSLAMHRHSPPQYNIILRDYAAQRRPDWIIYGLYENDFDEAEDFEAWNESGLDWFAFHSGNWAGRPVGSGAVARLTQRYTPELRRLFLRAAGRFGFFRAPMAESAERVATHIVSALNFAKLMKSNFLLVLIPSKQAVIGGVSPRAPLYADLLDRLRPRTDLRILDLAPRFRTCCGDPASLYYQIDGHWNEAGMTEGAKAIIEIVRAPLPPAAAAR